MTEKTNMDVWEKVCQPPVTALKQIKGGRLSGMTDINPQWRIQVMTEIYGACGTGWYYKINSMWPVDGANGEVMAFVHLDLFVKNCHVWSQPISGIGGSALVAKESSGLRANDEAYKMATTDALSVAMKQLGVGADIYMGRWDGTKYTVPASGVHKPTNNELYQPDAEELKFLNEIIVDVKSYNDDYVKAAVFLMKADLDSDEKTFIWDKLDPKTRSGIKKANAVTKEQ